MAAVTKTRYSQKAIKEPNDSGLRFFKAKKFTGMLLLVASRPFVYLILPARSFAWPSAWAFKSFEAELLACTTSATVLEVP